MWRPLPQDRGDWRVWAGFVAIYLTPVCAIVGAGIAQH